jgi:hypothetical protein
VITLASAAQGTVLALLGGAVSVSLIVAALIKAGAWIAGVNSRLARHDRALTRLGTAVADSEEENSR